MALTKTQTTVALVILAAAPLLWQKRAQANIAEQRNQLASVMASTQMEIEQWENQASQKMSQTRILQTEHQNADLLLQQKKARLLAGEAAPDYEWKDELPLARVPKELLNRLPLNSVRDRQGTLDPRVSQLLQLTEWERMRTQESMDRFLAEYQQAEAKRMKLVAPESKDLQEGSPEDVKVFEVSGMNEDLVRTQNGLFEDLREVLGDQRLAIFRKGLRDWMPLDDDNWGISTGMAIFPDDYRMRIYKPEPESGFVKWSVEVKDRGSFFATVKLDQMEEWIPPHFRVQVQEWLNLARPNPLSETDAVELNF